MHTDQFVCLKKKNCISFKNYLKIVVVIFFIVLKVERI
jgi:hypothetical protein